MQAMKTVPRDQASALSRLLRTFPAELEAWPRRGHSFEGLVVEELAAWAHRSVTRPELFFWRTLDGRIDLVPWDEIRSGSFDPRLM